jgi:hypothetical protein
LLSSWKVTFEGVDVEARPAAQDELRRLGVPGVPAVALGDRVVHGWNPGAVAELLGVDYAEPARLPPAELARRLDRILAVAQQAIRGVPAECLRVTTPGRDRTLRQLAYHVFRLSLAYRDALRELRLPKSWLDEDVPPQFADGEALAAYGGAVRAELGRWLGKIQRRGLIDTYYGAQTAHEVLERTVWHAAQHVRQLYALRDLVGLAPDAPLTVADLEGLPLPKDLW